jgi:uncharacterized protein
MQNERQNMTEEEKIAKILKEQKTIAVIGLSPKEHRTSHTVSAYLQKNGYRIIPVYPREEIILGEKVYRLASDIKEKVDTVLIFRRSEEVLPAVADALKIKPMAIWMQKDIINTEAAKLAEEAGVLVVMDRCMFVEHGNL